MTRTGGGLGPVAAAAVEEFASPPAPSDAADAGVEAGGVSLKPVPERAPASDSQPAVRPVGHAALQISKLLVEVLQIGHAGRRGGPDAGLVAPEVPASAEVSGVVAPGDGRGPLSSHVVRAAIHIYSHGPETIGQLAAGLGVSQGWASRVVDELERADYVARKRDPADRRVVRVNLVPTAIERVEKAYRWRGDAVEAALEELSPREREAVATFLRRFVHEARVSGS